MPTFHPSTRTVFGVGLLLWFGLTWALDLVAGKELSLWFLYAAPIVASAIAFGRNSAIGLSIVAGGLLLLNGYLLGNPFSTMSIYLVNQFSCVAAYFLIAWLASVVRGVVLEVLRPDSAEWQDLRA